jgi:hypothetical protein
MSAVKTVGGAVLLKDGAASCTCCDDDSGNLLDIDINIGETGDCQCAYPAGEGNPEIVRPCYSVLLPAPFTVTINGQSVTNVYSPFALWGGRSVVQIPWDLTTTPAIGWKSIVTEPTIMQLSGTVGGDVVIRGQRITGTSRYQGSPPEATTFQFIPQESEFPCGECGKNGPHAFAGQFVMYPFTIYTLDILAYLPQVPGTSIPACAPWLRARLNAIAPFAP